MVSLLKALDISNLITNAEKPRAITLANKLAQTIMFSKDGITI